MRVSYIHAARFPSEEANAVQVMRMCDAMRANGSHVELHVAGDPLVTTSSLHQYFGTHGFPIHRSWPNLSHRGATHLFAARSLYSSMVNRLEMVYTRNIVVAAIATSLNIPTIAEFHLPPSYMRPVYRRSLNRLLRRQSLLCLVLISNKLSEMYFRDLPDRSEALRRCILVAPDGASLQKRSDARDRIVDDFTAIFAGRFYRGRGLQQIYQMAVRMPEIRFKLIGGSEDEFKTVVKSATIPNNVDCIGSIPPADVESYLVQSDVLLAPYQHRVMMSSGTFDSAAFMSPLKIFEYMAAGAPIICSDMPVLREILDDQRNSLLVEADNINAWCNAINSLKSRPQLGKRLSIAAHQDLLQKYTWEKRAEAIWAFAL